jgi:tRNA pseudouridine38-40 synthase
MTRNIKLVVEYDGTDYAGWQWQPDEPTLQGALERAISKTTGEEIRVTASGRTDAGVHAYGQVVNFQSESALSAKEWHGALNHFLPDDIRVLEAGDAEPGFSARHSAKGKEYEYVVLNRRMPSPLSRHRAWHVAVPLDTAAMRSAALHLIGEHDFTSFRAAGCSANQPVRELLMLKIEQEGDRIVFTLGANAFLRHMVRNIVGTLVEVGRGRFTPDEVKAILDARDRTRSGPTAPPQGLYLVKVIY